MRASATNKTSVQYTAFMLKGLEHEALKMIRKVAKDHYPEMVYSSKRKTKTKNPKIYKLNVFFKTRRQK